MDYKRKRSYWKLKMKLKKINSKKTKKIFNGRKWLRAIRSISEVNLHLMGHFKRIEKRRIEHLKERIWEMEKE